jgi:hypothetical protein
MRLRRRTAEGGNSQLLIRLFQVWGIPGPTFHLAPALFTPQLSDVRSAAQPGAIATLGNLPSMRNAERARGRTSRGKS